MSGNPQYEHVVDECFVLKQQRNGHGQVNWVIREDRNEYSRVLYQTVFNFEEYVTSVYPPTQVNEWLVMGGAKPAPFLEVPHAGNVSNDPVLSEGWQENWSSPCASDNETYKSNDRGL